MPVSSYWRPEMVERAESMSDGSAIDCLLGSQPDRDCETQAAIDRAVDALRRLAAIRARHEQGAVTTDGGRVIYASIHGREMHRLLYGELDE